MRLPETVLSCIRTLESASFPTYAVGGCVRDWLLGLDPQDYDLCTAATPAQIQSVFSSYHLLLHGVKHGTVGVVIQDQVVEITTFRTEGGYTDSRHPDWVEFVTDIRADLSRRDFTVNAMAYSPTRGLEDPFGGQTDLRNKILRAVGDPDTRFREDALRILRGARFAARYGLAIDPATWDAMLRQLPLTDTLARERVLSELEKLLLRSNASDLLRFAPIITRVIPELAPALGFDQHSPHHAYDLFTHIAHVTAAVPRCPALRWAGLLHDVGKLSTFTQDDQGRGHFYGHADESARIADGVLRRLKAPTLLRDRCTWLIENHMTPLDPDPKLLRRRISRASADAVLALIDLQEADMGSKGTGKDGDPDFYARLRRCVRDIEAENNCLRLRDLAVNGQDLLSWGFPAGPAIGACLNHLLEQVLSEQLPNDFTALKTAAIEYLTHFPEDSQ